MSQRFIAIAKAAYAEAERAKKPAPTIKLV
jgi:hypothetical protein